MGRLFAKVAADYFSESGLGLAMQGSRPHGAWGSVCFGGSLLDPGGPPSCGPSPVLCLCLLNARVLLLCMPGCHRWCLCDTILKRFPLLSSLQALFFWLLQSRTALLEPTYPGRAVASQSHIKLWGAGAYAQHCWHGSLHDVLRASMTVT